MYNMINPSYFELIELCTSQRSYVVVIVPIVVAQAVVHTRGSWKGGGGKVNKISRKNICKK